MGPHGVDRFPDDDRHGGDVVRAAQAALDPHRRDGPHPALRGGTGVQALAQSRLKHPRIEAHNGGMNSATWLVEQDGRRWVAKAVAPYDRDAFAGGLAVAAELDRRGIPSGRPEPTIDGKLAVEAGDETIARLAFVPGEPLD